MKWLSRTATTTTRLFRCVHLASPNTCTETQAHKHKHKHKHKHRHKHKQTLVLTSLPHLFFFLSLFAFLVFVFVFVFCLLRGLGQVDTLDTSTSEFSFTRSASTYLIEVTATNSAGAASASKSVSTVPDTTTTTTSTTSAASTTNATSAGTPVLGGSTDSLATGEIAGIAAAGAALLLLLLVLIVARSSRSRVHEMTIRPDEAAEKKRHFWEIEEAQVEVKPRERARPILNKKFARTAAHMHDVPPGRADSRLWRDDYEGSEADSYSLATHNTANGDGGFPLRRRTTSLHGLLHNQHVQVLGQRNLDSAAGQRSDEDGSSPASPLPGLTNDHHHHGGASWSTPRHPVAVQQPPPTFSQPGVHPVPHHSHQHHQHHQPTHSHHQHQEQQQEQQQQHDELLELRSMLLEQQRAMQQYAARALEQAQAGMSTNDSYEGASSSQHQQQHHHHHHHHEQHHHQPRQDHGYLQIAPVPSSHVDEPSEMEMRSMAGGGHSGGGDDDDDDVSLADSDAPRVFTESLQQVQHEEDTWL